MREAVGPDVQIMVEMHGRFTPSTAARSRTLLEPYDPEWIEEPVPPENPAAMDRVRRRTRLPIATGERAHTMEDIRPFIEQGLVDVVQVDLTHFGGFLPMKRLAGWADAYYLLLAPHNVCGPVGTMANLHFAVATPNYKVLEHFNDFADSWVHDLVDHPPRSTADGCFALPRAARARPEAQSRGLRRASAHRRPHQAVRRRLGTARFRAQRQCSRRHARIPRSVLEACQLEFHDIRKSFGAVRALRGVSFSVAAGESHALMGENGAGKSTLLKILAGIVTPDTGEIRLEDRRLALSGPRDALAHGIGMVYQETADVPQPDASRATSSPAARSPAAAAFCASARCGSGPARFSSRLHLDLSPDAPMEHLSAAHAQLVQVARALAFECRVLVLDEPTTSLTTRRPITCSASSTTCAARGATILYVSHRMPEVFRLCDRITVLRDGQYVATFDRAAVTSDDVVRAMVGRDLPPRVAQTTPVDSPVVLEVAPAVGAAARQRRQPARQARRDRRRLRPRRVRPLGDARDDLRFAPGRDAARCSSAAGRCAAAASSKRRAPASRSCPRIASARGCCST